MAHVGERCLGHRARRADLALLPNLPRAANIFIGSLIFIEELADKIVQAVGPCRDSLDACLIFPSMPAVMKLNKLGSFSMSQLGECVAGGCAVSWVSVWQGAVLSAG